jgi:hypothetical protein
MSIIKTFLTLTFRIIAKLRIKTTSNIQYTKFNKIKLMILVSKTKQRMKVSCDRKQIVLAILYILHYNIVSLE